MAGERAVEACEEGNFSHDFLSEYEKRWYKLHGERDFAGWYMFKLLFDRPAKELDEIGRWLNDHDARFENEVFEIVSKSTRKSLRTVTELKRQGLDMDRIIEFTSIFKKYFRNYWDYFVE